MTDKDLHLTDEQYFRILGRAFAYSQLDNFKPRYEDSTETGNKYTWVNCGICNEDFSDKECALFPESWPERKSMKYKREHHLCPFDMRQYDNNGIPKTYVTCGCFYTCFFFQKYKQYGDKDKETVAKIWQMFFKLPIGISFMKKQETL